MRSIRLGRREFITLFGGAATSWPLAAFAQQPAKVMKRFAIVDPSNNISNMTVSESLIYGPMFEELSRLGYVEGQIE